MSKNRKLKVDYLDPAVLVLDEKNPRLHSDRQIKQIARSMQTFQFNAPVLVDANNKVIAGHGRVLAAKLIGMTEIPVIQLEHLSPTQARAYAIADNRLCEQSDWSKQLLGEAFRDLSAELNLDFSLEATGFSIAEIDLQIEGLSDPDAGKSDPADEIPALAKTAVTKIGDLWLLGPKHRLLCGSCLDRAAYKTLLHGKQANLVFADPPYNVRIDGHATGKGKRKHREFAMASGEMTPAEFTDFLARSFSHMARNSKPGAVHFICGDWRHVTEFTAAGNEVFSTLLNICVWKKHNAGMGSLYRSQHEFIFVYRHGTSKHVNNVELGKHGRSRTNVWEYPSANTLGKLAEDGDLTADHPTVKPVALIADVLRDCSRRGDIVLDPFLGSGTTLLAAERMGRIGYGIEIDPLYVDVAIRRWQRLTGENATLERAGQRFDDVAAGVRNRK